MPQFRQYTEATSLQESDAAVIDRLGVGTLYAPISLFPGAGCSLVTANLALSAPGVFLVRTSLGAFSGTLPALSTLTGFPGQVTIVDMDNNAGTHNFTINAAAGDAILNHSSSGGSLVMNVSNTFIYLFGVTGVGWRAIAFSG